MLGHATRGYWPRGTSLGIATRGRYSPKATPRSDTLEITAAICRTLTRDAATNRVISATCSRLSVDLDVTLNRSLASASAVTRCFARETEG